MKFYNYNNFNMVIKNQIHNIKQTDKKTVICTFAVGLSFRQRLSLLFTGQIQLAQMLPIDKDDNVVNAQCKGIISKDELDLNNIVNEYLSTLRTSKEEIKEVNYNSL